MSVDTPKITGWESRRVEFYWMALRLKVLAFLMLAVPAALAAWVIHAVQVSGLSGVWQAEGFAYGIGPLLVMWVVACALGLGRQMGKEDIPSRQAQRESELARVSPLPDPLVHQQVELMTRMTPLLVEHAGLLQQALNLTVATGRLPTEASQAEFTANPLLLHHSNWIEQIPMAALCVDLSGRVRGCNEAWRQLGASSHVPQSLTESEPLPALFGPLKGNDSALLTQRILSVLDPAQPRFSQLIQWDAGDGKLLELQCEAVRIVRPTTAKDAPAPEALVIFHDVSALVQSGRLQALLQNVFDLLPVAVTITDGEGQVLTANERYEQLIGKGGGRPLPGGRKRAPRFVQPGGDWLAVNELPPFRAAAERRVVADVQIGLPKTSGMVWLGVTSIPLPEPTGGAVTVYMDITAKLESDKQLLEAKVKAEEAAGMKSSFLANMSHEIRTPMNAVIGLAHLALKTDLNRKQRDYVHKIHMAGTSLLGVINDILDFSKIEAGKMEIVPTPFSLDEMLASVATVTSQKAQEKGLEFLIHVPPHLPRSYVGDSMRLGQILINLVNNAIKFTAKGQVQLRVHMVSSDENRIRLRFQIMDTGIGMTKAQIEKLFQPFVQADGSTTRRFGGTGLGLTISKRLVGLMGGDIWVESEDGQGSSFFFTADLSPCEEVKAPLRVIGASLTGLRALVVDDNPMAREIMGESLVALSFHVDSVSSGEEALSALTAADNQGRCFDIVFLDWSMPGMSGIDVAAAVSRLPLSRQPKMIMVTAHGNDDVRHQAEESHFNGFLVKPVNTSMLVDAVVGAFSAGDSSEPVEMVKDRHAERDRLLAGVRVLLAEDNEINQQIAVELLTDAGMVVDVANHGQQALDRLNAVQGGHYTLLLLDLQMPVLDGHETALRLRRDHRFDKLPILAMTAHAMVEERDRCMAEGMQDHITKPIDPPAMFRVLRRWVKAVADGDDLHVISHSVTDTDSPALVPATPLPTPSLSPSASPTPAAQPVDRLSQVRGLNAKDGLLRVGGNPAFYLEMLGRFCSNQADAAAQLKDALQSRNLQLAERIAHTLKGVAGTLGAQELFVVAGEIEQQIRSGSATVDAEPLAGMLKQFIDEISMVQAQDQAEGKGEVAAIQASGIDLKKRDALLEKLSQLLSQDDADAVFLFNSERAALEAVLGQDACGRMALQLEAFNFSDARETLLASGVVPANSM